MLDKQPRLIHSDPLLLHFNRTGKRSQIGRSVRLSISYRVVVPQKVDSV